MNINAVKDAMPAEEESHHDHGHDFASVVEFLLEKPDYFSIDGFEEYLQNDTTGIIYKQNLL